MPNLVPPVVSNNLGKLLNFEIEKKGKNYDCLRKNQKRLQNIIGFKPYERGIDGFHSRDSIRPDGSIVILDLCSADHDNKERLDKIHSCLETDLGDTFGVLHLINKEILKTSKNNINEDNNKMKHGFRTSLFIGLKDIQSQLNKYPEKNRPKFIMGISHVSKFLETIGFNMEDLTWQKRLTSAYINCLSDSSDTYKIKEIRTNTYAGIAGILNEEKISSKTLANRIHRKKKAKKIMDEKTKVKNKYSAKDIKLAMIDIEKFMLIDFDQFVPRIGNKS